MLLLQAFKLRVVCMHVTPPRCYLQYNTVLVCVSYVFNIHFLLCFFVCAACTLLLERCVT